MSLINVSVDIFIFHSLEDLEDLEDSSVNIPQLSLSHPVFIATSILSTSAPLSSFPVLDLWCQNITRYSVLHYVARVRVYF